MANVKVMAIPPKPETAPQKENGGDCPSTSCCASFESEYLGLPYTPTKEEIRLRELAEEYHRTCEDYDRTICTGPIKDGAIMPAHGAEVSAISRHAQAVRDGLWRHVAPLGFSRQQWMEAISDVGRHYRHNSQLIGGIPSDSATSSD